MQHLNKAFHKMPINFLEVCAMLHFPALGTPSYAGQNRHDYLITLQLKTSTKILRTSAIAVDLLVKLSLVSQAEYKAGFIDNATI